MYRFLILGVVIVLVGLPLTLLSLREFKDDPTLHLDALNRSVSGVLKKLPGVAEVEVHRILKPNHRIIQLRDRHFVPRDDFAIELRASSSQPLKDEEIDRLYREFISEVNSIQEEQMELLRVLIKNHGLKRIHAEGFSKQDLPAYREKIAALKALEANQITKLKKQLQEVREVLADKPSPEARSIEGRILGMLADFQVRLIEMGAVGRLLIDGEIEDVLPIEDADVLEKANPITPDNKVRLDQARITERHDAIVRNVLKDGSLALINLGGEHDLTESINQLGGGKCEYIRVTTKRYKEINGE